MNKKNIITILVGIIILGVGFYGGILYSQNKTPANQNQARGQFSQNNGNRPAGLGRNTLNGNTVTGEIISKDNTSLTVKLRDGGSRIVLITGNTPVTKTVPGTFNDLSSNEQVVVLGTPNADGSLSAQTIQIRPAQPNASSTQQ
ncbi:MAG: hypothetical protein WCO12_01700 [bacterium]